MFKEYYHKNTAKLVKGIIWDTNNFNTPADISVLISLMFKDIVPSKDGEILTYKTDKFIFITSIDSKKKRLYLIRDNNMSYEILNNRLLITESNSDYYYGDIKDMFIEREVLLKDKTYSIQYTGHNRQEILEFMAVKANTNIKKLLEPLGLYDIYLKEIKNHKEFNILLSEEIETIFPGDFLCIINKKPVIVKCDDPSYVKLYEYDKISNHLDEINVPKFVNGVEVLLSERIDLLINMYREL